jgi:glutathione peroxidase
MRLLLSAALLLGSLASMTFADQPKDGADHHEHECALNFKMKTIDNETVDLEDYEGKVVLIVNTASRCGLTPQYAGLQDLYEKYQDKGFVVLGFPCNQFGSQEPGTAEEIKQFCSTKYSVSFPMFEKIEVNGDGAAPLYKYLTSKNVQPAGEGKISWNFEKFLIDREGNLVHRFAPKTKPTDADLLKSIESELQKSDG